MTISRRRFLHTALLAAGGYAVASSRTMFWHLAAGDQNDDDAAIAAKVFTMAERRGIANAPIGEIVAAVGEYFIGAPYVAHTLEVEGEERLIVNLRAFDCTTFVESTLALARCIQAGTPSFEGFQHQLQYIRYRGGTIEGYPSRLHYVVDWIADNARKGVVKDVTATLGGKPIERQINFMTSHRSAYHQLADAKVVEAIAERERQLSTTPYVLLAKENIAKAERHMKSGEIVAIATSIEGLDVSHTGFAVRKDGKVRFLHAPLSSGAVRVSATSLHEYVAGNRKATGILVARPVQPAQQAH